MKTKMTLVVLLIAAVVSLTVYAGVAGKANCCPSGACCTTGAACCK